MKKETREQHKHDIIRLTITTTVHQFHLFIVKINSDNNKDSSIFELVTIWSLSFKVASGLFLRFAGVSHQAGRSRKMMKAADGPEPLEPGRVPGNFYATKTTTRSK